MSLHSSARGVFRPTTTPLPREERLPAAPPDGPREFHFAVDFPSRMPVGQLQTVHVELVPVEPLDRLVDSGRSLVPEPFPVRLIVPGALVTPSEQGLDPSLFAPATAVFYVTPLATGDLPQARAELLRDGRLDVVQLPMRCHNQVLPWLIVGLMVLVPVFLHTLATADSSTIQHVVTNWIPGLDGNSSAQQVVASGLKLMRQMHASFVSFLALLVAAFWIVLVRRPNRMRAKTEPFSIGSSANPRTPPSYLTPVSNPDLGAVPARGF